MSNEFTGLRLECVPPNLVPQGPNASPQYQSCTLAGSKPGQTYVEGADYIKSSFTYTRTHLWRNFGFSVVFFHCLRNTYRSGDGADEAKFRRWSHHHVQTWSGTEEDRRDNRDWWL